MTVYDLNRDQLIEVKQRYYIENIDDAPDYYTLANIDEIVSDATIYDAYAGTDFVTDDFFSTAGEDGNMLSGSVEVDPLNKETVISELRYIANKIESGIFQGTTKSGTVWDFDIVG